MIRFSRSDQLVLVAAASRAPSVHNIQPARWRFEDRGIVLLADPLRKLPIGDPTGRDVGVSLGAAVEGMVIALAARGLTATSTPPTDVRRAHPNAPEAILRLEFGVGAQPDPLQPFTFARTTWRGKFAADPAAREAVLRLGDGSDDIATVTSDKQIAEIAELFDTTSLAIMRDDAYRSELVSWMRLSRSHPDYLRDGLNAEVMQLGAMEARGAGIVLGPQLFRALDRMGLCGAFLAESRKVRTAAGLILFHRPPDEDPITTGRRFYRLWLEAEREGLAMCPMSVLADVASAAQELTVTCALPRGRRLVNVFRVGRRLKGKPQRRFRLPPESLFA